ncbi:MAG: hypothetical protein BWX88_04353 [Planctomycetes bacterium ADurb.Bin126]|nr:MAG: hypothetical protein BWX88_04353 [Planctomycetes bacterium ADurb.Bin126]
MKGYISSRQSGLSAVNSRSEQAPGAPRAGTDRPGQHGGDNAIWKSTLSPARRWLIEAMQRLGFGRIKHLIIINAEPVIEPPPKLYRCKRLNGPNRQRETSRLQDFILKEPVLAMLQEFDRIRNGVVTALEVRDGLPCEMTLEEDRRA